MFSEEFAVQNTLWPRLCVCVCSVLLGLRPVGGGAWLGVWWVYCGPLWSIVRASKSFAADVARSFLSDNANKRHKCELIRLIYNRPRNE